jgi:hypothetical protein
MAMNRTFTLSSVFLLALSSAALAQTNLPKAAKAVKSSSIPRDAEGHPNLEGIWTNVTITPFERPAELAGKEFFTPQEATVFEKESVQKKNKDVRQRGTVADVTNAYNDFWWDSGTKVVKTLRTSMVVDPKDGRIPALTPERKQQVLDRAAKVKTMCAQPLSGCEVENSGLLGPAGSAEERPLMERCISFGTVGPPMLPSAYNNNFQIAQSKGTIAIEAEMVHDTRLIPLDGSAHLPADIRQWKGDSRGHWEGDTLVIDTTNFTDQTRFRNTDQNLHITERLTLTDPDTIIYRFTVDDPTAYTKPWTAELPMVRTPGPLFEYACHEGNTGMTGILAAARADEKAAAGKK